MYKGDECVRSWMNGCLTKEEIEEYLKECTDILDNSHPIELTHVSDVCYSMYMYLRHGRPPGDFVTNFCDNDLLTVIGISDDVIRKNLKYMVLFVKNASPGYVPSAIRSDENAREYVKDKWDD